jgi:hypothetical protein
MEAIELATDFHKEALDKLFREGDSKNELGE